jgi:hypothetical protein
MNNTIYGESQDILMRLQQTAEALDERQFIWQLGQSFCTGRVREGYAVLFEPYL